MRSTRRSTRLPALALGCLAFGLAVQPLAATHVAPVFVAGNPTCAGLGYDFGFRIDPPDAGTYAIDTFHSVTVTTDGTFFDWTSTLGIDAVIAKGGPNANVYVYDPPAEAFADTGLHSPINANNGRPFGLSHIDFCFDYEVTVSKTAETTFTRTYHWDIDKSVSPELWTLFTGDSGTSLYTVEVTRTGFTDSDWAVAGTITIENATPLGATIESVADVISPALAAAVDCGVVFPYALAPGGTLECTYEAALPDGGDRLNTATVTTSGLVGGGVGTAAVEFGAPTTEINASVTVSDTNGSSWTFNDSGSVTYTRTFLCDGNAGVHPNTATIVETGQSDSASVAVQCYGLQVSKDAHTSLTRTWDWTIEKSADQTELTLSPGQSFLVNYTVSLDASSADSGWTARGTITIANPNPVLPAVISDVSDLAGGTPAAVDCGAPFPLAVAPAGSLSCTYEVALASATTVTNVATATLRNFSYDPSGSPTATGTTPFSGSATVDFAGADVLEVDECVEVDDSLQGALGSLCADAAPASFTYSRLIGPFAEPEGCGPQEVTNTASFETNDTGATGESSWTVLVNVVCDQGCTLTPGYWKTHSRRGPAPYDDTWALLGPAQENAIFFLSGRSYYQALWTPPAGNAYYILAHAYIATTLNFLNGADAPPEVLSAWNEATTLFQTYTPAQLAAQRGNQQPRKRFLELAGLLDMYNNGLLGPGHCSE